MGFAIFMFLCTLFIPALMFISGRFMHKCPPKSINGFYGYRTRRSSMNADTWAFAHDYCGRLWEKLSILLLVLSVASFLPFANKGESILGMYESVVMGVQSAVLVLSIIPVERALKRTFDEKGNRRAD